MWNRLSIRKSKSFRKERVGERELQKVKNQFAADNFSRLESRFFLMLQILLADSNRGWQSFNEDPKRIAAVTADDVQRVANLYFKPENRTVALYYTKKSEAGAEDPLLTGLSDQEKVQVRQFREAVAKMSMDEAKAILAKTGNAGGFGASRKEELCGGAPQTAAGRKFKMEGSNATARDNLESFNLVRLLPCSRLSFFWTSRLGRRQIPPHPRDLKYQPLQYTPPKASAYRQVLSNGVVGFFVEDHDLPLVNVSILIRAGSLSGSGRERRAGGRNCEPVALRRHGALQGRCL